MHGQGARHGACVWVREGERREAKCRRVARRVGRRDGRGQNAVGQRARGGRAERVGARAERVWREMAAGRFYIL